MTARVLIIDDEPQILRFLSHALTASGYAVTQANTARDGLQAARDGVPDLVILDLNLPKANGKEVLGVIKNTLNCTIFLFLFFQPHHKRRVYFMLRKLMQRDI